MNSTSIRLLALVCFVLIMGSCGRLSNNEIKKSWWKHGSGHNIGDALRFDNENLSDDTIYSNDQAIAIILRCGKGLFRKTAILEIEDLRTGEEGVYHDKGPR